MEMVIIWSDLLAVLGVLRSIPELGKCTAKLRTQVPHSQAWEMRLYSQVKFGQLTTSTTGKSG